MTKIWQFLLDNVLSFAIIGCSASVKVSVSATSSPSQASNKSPRIKNCFRLGNRANLSKKSKKACPKGLVAGSFMLKCKSLISTCAMAEGLSVTKSTKLCIQKNYFSITFAWVITTGVVGTSAWKPYLPVGTPLILLTMSMPSITLPNTV